MPTYLSKRIVFSLAVLGILSCGGSDNTGVQARSFASSVCKKERVAQSGASFSSSLLVIADETGLDGLRCVAWQRVGASELKLDLYNFDSACGATWSGTAAPAADGSLAVHIDNPSCTIARCGKCLYDWSFDLGVAVSTSVATRLTVTVDACQGQQAAAYFTSTIGPEDQGMRCTYADYGAIDEQAATAGTCGKAGWPCVGSLLCGSGSLTSTGTCDAGLTCDSSVAENEPRCLVPCATAADCPRSDAWICLAGLCRPAT